MQWDFLNNISFEFINSAQLSTDHQTSDKVKITVSFGMFSTD